MRAVLFAAPVLSFLLLGAHFMREGAVFLTASCAALAISVFWRHPQLSRVLQAALVLGTLEWAWTAITLVQQRVAEGRPWGRMAIILLAVALVTAASAAAVEALLRKKQAAA
jgi:hypothetical protein